MFTSFHEPATAGLRLLYSYDGYKWKDLDTVFQRPMVDQKVMRDPSIARGPDGVFHLVFTSAWKGSKCFGYASSKDLINWSGQPAIVKRADDDYVLVLKDNTRPERNLKVAFSKHPAGPYSTASAPFTPNFTEGPSVALSNTCTVVRRPSKSFCVTIFLIGYCDEALP